MIERMGGDFADKLQSPRLLKTHFTYMNLPKGNSNVKYIYAVRNPKDCLTRYGITKNYLFILNDIQMKRRAGEGRQESKTNG